MTGTARRRLFGGAVIVLGTVILLLLRGVAPIPGLRLPWLLSEWLPPGFILWGFVTIVYPRAMFDPNEDIGDLRDGRSLDGVPVLAFLICVLTGVAVTWWLRE